MLFTPLPPLLGLGNSDFELQGEGLIEPPQKKQVGGGGAGRYSIDLPNYWRIKKCVSRCPKW